MFKIDELRKKDRGIPADKEAGAGCGKGCDYRQPDINDDFRRRKTGSGCAASGE